MKCLKLRFLLLIIYLSINVFSFNYNVLTTENFIFYFPDNFNNIQKISRLGEAKYKELSKNLNFEIKSKIKVVIRNNNHTGAGEVSPLKGFIDINTFSDLKNHYSFEELFCHELVHVFQFRIIKEKFSGIDYYLNLSKIPLWFYEAYAEGYSKEYNPFYITKYNFFPQYNINELNIFYWRDSINRQGGYFYSYLFFNYLQEKYGKKDVAEFLREQTAVKKFYTSFEKSFGKLNNVYNDFLIDAEKKYLFSSQAENIRTNFFNTELPVIFDENIYYVAKHRTGNNFLVTGKEDNVEIIKGIENIHSFNLYGEENVIFSKLEKRHSGNFIYRIYTKEKGKVSKLPFSGIYPHRENNFLTFSSGEGKVYLIELENEKTTVFDGFMSKIKNNKLYFFEPENNRLMEYSINTETVKPVINYAHTGYWIDFYQEMPVINIYENGNFGLKTVDEKYKQKLFDFNYHAAEFAFSSDSIFFTTYYDRKKILVSEKIEKNKFFYSFKEYSDEPGQHNLLKENTITESIKKYSPHLSPQMMVPWFEFEDKKMKFGFFSIFEDELETENLIIKNVYNTRAGKINLDTSYFNNRVQKPYSVEFLKYDFRQDFLGFTEFYGKTRAKIKFKEKINYNSYFEYGAFYEKYSPLNQNLILFDGSLYGGELKYSFERYGSSEHFPLMTRNLFSFETNFTYYKGDKDFEKYFIKLDRNLIDRKNFVFKYSLNYEKLDNLDFLNPLLLLSTRHNFNVRGVRTEMYFTETLIHNFDAVFPLYVNYADKKIPNTYGFKIFGRIFHDLCEGKLANIDADLKTSGAGFDFWSVYRGKIPFSINTYYIKDDRNEYNFRAGFSIFLSY
ncbi:MAG: hypothetical protein WC337_04615 [Candidatus Muiribacteriota bacterium]